MTGDDTVVVQRHLAVVVSRFPKFTETFVANEILAFQRAGVEVDVYPLLPPEPEPHQPFVRALVEQARYGPMFGVGPLAALGRWCRRRPGALLRMVRVLVAETWRNPRFMAKDLVLVPRIAAIADELVENRVQHVHAHFATHAGFAAWSIHQLTGLPYSIVAHGSDVHRHQAMLGVKVADASFVATVSSFNRSVILSVSNQRDAARIEVVRVGVNLAAIDDVVARTVRTGAQSHSVPVIVCVGTLHEVKGQRYLLEAVAVLLHEGRRVCLELVGDGPDRLELERLAGELGITEHVRFAGSLAHDDVIATIASASVLVAPSVASSDGRKEGIPTVLIEAMAAGVPVVASDLAGIGELVEDGVSGRLAPAGEPDQLARVLAATLDDTPPRRDALLEAARRRVEREFSVDATAATMLGLIERWNSA